jgi:fatty-acyl-CoA synthase
LRIVQYFGLGPDDRFVGWLPLYHCGGDESLYATLLSGGAFAVCPKAEPERMFTLIERHRLTWTLLLPGVITDFLNHPKRETYDLSSMRFAFGYANMMPQVVKELTSAVGMDYYDAFGQTETSYLVAYDRIPPGTEPSLRKTPTPFLDVRIVDDDMRELPVGEPGECVVRGPTVMSGYLDDPEATAEVFRGGWLHTGDVLVRHEDGTLSFTDRKKYLIKTGGENVYPALVEQVLAAHEAVEEVSVFGIPDPRWGETIKATVVVREGQAVTGAELADWCRGRLAGYQRPHFIEFVRSEDLPRSVTGKVLRHELAERPTDDSQRV